MFKRVFLVVCLFVILVLPIFFSAFFSDSFFQTIAIRSISVMSFAILVLYLKYVPIKSFYKVTLQTSLTLFCFFISIPETVCYYMTGKSYAFSFWMHFNINSLVYGGARGFLAQIIVAVIVLIFAIAMIVYVFRQLGRTTLNKKLILIKIIILVAVLGIFCGTINKFPPVIFIKGFYQYHTSVSVHYNKKKMEENGINTNIVPIEDQRVLKGKNLVYIFLESIEQTYLDENLFPGLIPNIKKFVGKDAVFFPNVKEAEHANFTLGGMFAAMTGGILSNQHILGNGLEEWNGGFNPNVAQNLPTLPEALKIAGYHQVFMRAASLQFAGTNLLLEKLKFNEMYDTKDFKDQIKDKSLIGAWGVRDNALFQVAFDKYVKLSKSKQPFNLTLLTVDTHPPDGLTFSGSLKYGDGKSNLLNAVHTTDYELGQFIEKLKTVKGWENTVIAISNDHLAMSSSTDHAMLIKNPQRKMLFFALNAGPHKVVKTDGATFDIAPTVLDLLKVKTNIKFPLGQDLLKKTNPKRLTWNDNKSDLWEAYCSKFTRKLAKVKHKRLNIKVIPGQEAKIEVGGQVIPITLNDGGWQGLPYRTILFVITLDEYDRVIKATHIHVDPKLTLKFNNKFYRYVVLGREADLKSSKLINPKNPLIPDDNLVLLYGRQPKWDIRTSKDGSKLSMSILRK
jgi:hypothetical protein